MTSGSYEPNRPVAFTFWRDPRFWRISIQAVVLIALVGAGWVIWGNITSALRANNQAPDFEFFQNDGLRAGFELGGVANYSPDDSYRDAFFVGLDNTLQVVIWGNITATILGVLVGIFLLSRNWLIRNIALVYVEILRNTPLLVQLLIWYFVIFAALPRSQEAIELPGGSIDVLWRWVIYVLVGAFIGVSFSSNRRGVAPQNRRRVIAAGLAAASVIEVGFWLLETALLQGNMGLASALQGTLLSPVVLGLALVSGLAFWAVGRFLADSNARDYLFGVVVGVGLGVLAFYLSWIPAGYLLRIEGALLSLSARGVYLPQIFTTPRFATWMTFVVFGVIIAVAQGIYLGDITERSGRQFPRVAYGLLAILVLGGIGWWVVQLGAPPYTPEILPADVTVEVDDPTVTLSLSDSKRVIRDRNGIHIITAEGQEITPYEALRLRLIEPLHIVALEPNAFTIFPVIRDDAGRRYVAGSWLTPEFMAILVGSVIYASAFIAEIVRAGILAVPKGQREAAQALGLSNNDMLLRVILPQALRVIIPPMTNQYLNLSKNSSLAIIISYFDVFNVMNTIINQTGQSVGGIVLIMVTYLIISLVISLLMNILNQRFQLVTR
ncbi:MAG: ABC transporter permease subunit [Phototrophicaceae bacterium]|jgi:His/Glu/Gln/Arg/opine family amino acid ABC transporter permease subunit